MTQNNNSYCRLEISYDRLFQDEPTATKQKSLFLKKDVYVQNFDSINSFNIFGKSGYFKQLEKIQGRNFIFMTPEFHGIEEMFLLSDELVNLELEYFLENPEMTDEVKQKVFYPEMVKKGFIEVLGSI